MKQTNININRQSTNQTTMNNTIRELTYDLNWLNIFVDCAFEFSITIEIECTESKEKSNESKGNHFCGETPILNVKYMIANHGINKSLHTADNWNQFVALIPEQFREKVVTLIFLPITAANTKIYD